jgi:hypothetical protein
VTNEPTPVNSGWTVDTLLAYWKDRHTDLQLQMEQRFTAQQRALEAAMAAQGAAINAALAASDKSADKTEKAMNDRFAAVNEFRQTLSDQAATFVHRTEVDAMYSRNTERIQDVADRVDKMAEKNVVISQYDQLAAQIRQLSERVTRAEGKGSGMQTSWVVAVAVITIVIALAALYINYHK